MSFFDKLKKDWSEFEGVVVKDEQLARAELEKIFGKDKVDAAIAQAEAAAKTELGSIAAKIVPLVESKLINAAGPLKASTAFTLIQTICSAIGLNVTAGAINAAIETIVPFVAHVALNAVTAAV